MNGGRGLFVRNGRMGCFKRVYFEKSSILDYLNQASTLTKQQQARTYSRFPYVFKESAISPPSLCSSFSSSSSLVRNGFVGWYLGMIKSHPILTKSVTSAGIYTAADFSSQRLTPTCSDSYDLLRTLRMAGYGMLVAGPTMHFWFNFVSKVMPKRDVVTTLKKIFAGQTVYGPIMTCVFFSLNAGLQGESGPEIVARLKRDLLPTLTNGLMYWPMCDFVTFKFIPVPLQPLISNSFAFLWTIYITYMASLKRVDADNIALA